MESNATHSRPRTAYHNLMLTLLVAGVGVLILDRGPSGPAVSGSVALAAPPEDDVGDAGGRISAADQRKQIISEIKAISTKLGQIEATMKKGIKISEMPMQKDAGAAPVKAN